MEKLLKELERLGFAVETFTSAGRTLDLVKERIYGSRPIIREVPPWPPLPEATPMCLHRVGAHMWCWACKEEMARMSEIEATGTCFLQNTR